MNITWPYLAGFFDGEGHLNTRNASPRFQITQKPVQVLEKIKEFLKTQHNIQSGIYVHKPGKNRGEDNHVLAIQKTKDVVYVLKHIFPYLIVKKTVAQDVLRYYKIYDKLVRSRHSQLVKNK